MTPLDSNRWVDPFEAAWQRGEPLELDAVVADVAPGPARRRLLEQLIPIDLEYRWKRGVEPKHIEDYTSRFADLASSDAPLSIDLIADEYSCRLHANSPPRPSDYERRFPQRWPELRPRLEARRGSLPPGYESLGTLGEGGMGVVIKARHAALDRVVALKVVRGGGLASSAARARFRAEAEVVARLQHPNIVQIFEVGEHAGLPFLAMEYVPGGTLGDRLKSGPLAPTMAARMLAELARAIQHAHDHGIIHRDLKPANILLKVADSQDKSAIRNPKSEIPKIADFGLAKRVDSQGSTRTGEVFGTLAYMAPEQAAGKTKSVGPAVDIYGLGAVLYECLTARPPFGGDSPVETLRQVQRDPPEPPRRIARSVPRDLETICLKCLEKEPGRRYTTAAALADDLDRFLRHEPITARRIGSVGRAVRWGQRYPLAAAAMTAMTLISAVALYFAVVAQTETAKGKRLLYVSDLSRASAAVRNCDFEALGPLFERHGASANSFEWNYWNWRYRDRPMQRQHPGDIMGVAFDPRGRWFATAGMERIIIWNRDGSERRRLRQEPDKIICMAVAPGGEWLACGGNEDVVKIWDPQTGEQIAELPHEDDIRWLDALSGGRIAVFDGSNRLRVWDVAAKQETAFRQFEYGSQLRVSPDGRRALVISSRAGELQLEMRTFDTNENRTILSRWVGSVFAFTPRHGERFACADPLQGLMVGDSRTGKKQVSIPALDSVQSLAFSYDSRFLAISGSRLTMLAVHDTSTGRELIRLPGHSIHSNLLAVSPDTRQLASASFGELRVWNLDRFPERWQHRADGFVPRIGGVAFHPGGEHLAVACHDSIRIRNVRSGREILWPFGKPNWTPAVAWSPDGRFLIASGQDDQRGKIRIWDAETGAVLRDLWQGAHVLDFAFTPDGRQIVAGSFDDPGGTVAVWDVATGQKLMTLGRYEKRAFSVAISPDGNLIAAAGSLGEISIWDARTGDLIQDWKPDPEFEGHRFAFAQVVFRPNGELAVAGPDSVIHFCNPKTLKARLSLPALAAEIGGLAFTPDGSRLAATCHDGTIRMWDADTGDELISLEPERQRKRFSRLAFSPDGAKLIVSGDLAAVFLIDGSPFTPEREAERDALGRIRFEIEHRGLTWHDAVQHVCNDPAAPDAVRRLAGDFLAEQP